MTEKKKQTAVAKSETALSIMEQFQAKTMEVWQDEDAVREMFGQDLTPIEFKFFISLGSMMGANPFVGEIWPVKYDKGKPASIFLGRNFKRRKAQELEDYNGHFVAAVYEKDEFTVVDELPVHKYAQGDRGKLIRAYCLVYKKSNPKPCYHEVKFNEYNTGRSTWAGKPETMIKKVAENQCLTMAFQGTFQGTYDESEQWKEQDPENVQVDPKMEVSTEKVRDHDDTGFEVETEKPLDEKIEGNSAGKELKTKTPAEMAEDDAKNLEESPKETTEEMAKCIEREVKEKVHKEETEKDTGISVEDAIKEVGEQTTIEKLDKIWEKYSSLHDQLNFIGAVSQIRSNIESAIDQEAKEAFEATEQQVIDDEFKNQDEAEPISGENLLEKKKTYAKLVLAVNGEDKTKASSFLSRHCGVDSFNQVTAAMFPILDKALSDFANPTLNNGGKSDS